MFYVSNFSKEAVFDINAYQYALQDTKQIGIYSNDVDDASVLYKRIKKVDNGALQISINPTTYTQVAFVVGQYDTSHIDAAYIFHFTRNDAIGIIPPIEHLEETNWLMFKHIIDSLEDKGLLNTEAKALKAKRDLYRQQIDEYNNRTPLDISHEPPPVDIADGAAYTPILDTEKLNKLI